MLLFVCTCKVSGILPGGRDAKLKQPYAGDEQSSGVRLEFIPDLGAVPTWHDLAGCIG